MMHKIATLSFISLLAFVSTTDITEIAFGTIDDAIPAAYGKVT